MSKQLRMACQVLDMLREGKCLTAVDLSIELEYDETSVRQMLRVMCAAGYARDIGPSAPPGRHGTKPRRYVAGPKLEGVRHV